MSKIKQISFSRLFKGRLSRKNYIIGFLLMFLPSLFLVVVTDEMSPSRDDYFFELIALIIFAAAFVLCMALVVRRLHDINISGKKLYWSIPAFVIPLIWIYIVYLLFITIWEEGDGQANNYGEKPVDDIMLLDAIFNQS